MRRNGEHVACEQCGELYYRRPHQAVIGRRFCGQQCRKAARQATITEQPCEVCQGPVRVFASRPNPRFCSRDCRRLGMMGWPLERMHNGVPARKSRYGYVMIYEPDHPDKRYCGWQFEHRMIMERELGRRLRSDEHVDHINRMRDDNRLENLQVLSKSAHMKKTANDVYTEVRSMRAELAAYRARYGPLEQE